MQDKKIDSSFIFITLILSIWIYRFIILSNNDFGLYLDEAYYYNWAQHLDFGYYSKPPMLSYLIFLTTHLFGDGVVAIKIGSLLIYPITTVVIYLISYELFDDKKIALYSALIFFTLPSMWLSSLIISTDVVLLLFWSLSLLFFIKALKYNLAKYWILAGIFSGFGLLSKYNFIFFLISVILSMIFLPQFRKHFKNRYFYLAVLIAFLIFLPNLYWNYQNDFISFSHTSEISQIDKGLFHPNKLLEFFGAQFLVFGPILFFYFWVIIFKRDVFKDDRFFILFLFSIVTLATILTLSFLSRSFANWAAPTYISATVLVVAYLVQKHKEWLLKLSVAISIMLGVLFYHYHFFANILKIELTAKSDPYKRINGWIEISKEIQKVYKNYPNTTLLSDDRAEIALFDYYLKTKTYSYNPKKLTKHQYHLTRDLNELKNKNFLYVTKKDDIADMKKYFQNISKVKRVNIQVYKDFNRSYNIFYLQKFKGY